MRSSTSRAATLRSLSSASLPCASPRSLTTSVRTSWSSLTSLQLRLVDLGLGLGDGRDQLAPFALDSGGLALQGREPRDRHKTLVEQLLHAREFARDQLQLLGLGRNLRLEADDFLAKLRYLALEQLLLALARRRPRPEQRRLRSQHRLDIVVVQPRRHFGRDRRLGQTIALGDQPGALRPHFVELLADHLKAGLRLRRIQPQQQVAGVDPHAVMDRDLRDHAAGRMLDGLDVGLHHQIARHHHGARQRHQRHPAPHYAADHEQRPQPGAQFALVGTSSAQHDAFAGRARHVRRSIAVGEECDACGQAVADHARHGTIARYRARRARRRQLGRLDARRHPRVVDRKNFRPRPRDVHERRIVGRDDRPARLPVTAPGHP